MVRGGGSSIILCLSSSGGSLLEILGRGGRDLFPVDTPRELIALPSQVRSLSVTTRKVGTCGSRGEEEGAKVTNTSGSLKGRSFLYL